MRSLRRSNVRSRQPSSRRDGRVHMLESMGAYYPDDENPRDPDELIWGRFTEEQWEEMACDQRADAIHAYLSGTWQ